MTWYIEWACRECGPEKTIYAPPHPLTLIWQWQARKPEICRACGSVAFKRLRASRKWRGLIGASAELQETRPLR